MGKVFEVELSGGNHRYCELTLPATDYELLDALDKLQMKPGEHPSWEICEHSNNTGHLQVFLNDCTIYELNAFARKLGNMTREQRGAFEGLLQMALDKREGPMCAADLFTYANSTDVCHVLGEVQTDEQLGRFYAENGFIPELDDIPDFVFDRLDFAKIGREMRTAEHGVFTHYGYVLQQGDLKPEQENMNISPNVPDYTLRLLIARYPFEGNGEPGLSTHINLPADAAQTTRALERIAAASWEEIIFTTEDSAVPGFPEELYGESFDELNEYAQTIKEIQEAGNLPKLKAVLSTKECTTISEAIQIAEKLDTFIFEPKVRTPEDVARDEINAAVSAQSIDTITKHIDLYGYGRDLIEEYGSQLTMYGLVTPYDEPALEQAETNAPQMTM